MEGKRKRIKIYPVQEKKNLITSISVNIMYHNTHELRLIISIRMKNGIGSMEENIEGRKEKKEDFKKETCCNVHM